MSAHATCMSPSPSRTAKYVAVLTPSTTLTKSRADGTPHSVANRFKIACPRESFPTTEYSNGLAPSRPSTSAIFRPTPPSDSVQVAGLEVLRISSPSGLATISITMPPMTTTWDRAPVAAIAISAPTAAFCCTRATLLRKDSPLVNSATRMRIYGVTACPVMPFSAASCKAV
eukprot:scaffold6754_cov148-Amphora_coffeaeformis.AAC.4